MAAWATKDQARRHWMDGQAIDDVKLDELLQIATTACRKYAPKLRRSLADLATTNGTTTVTSETARFDEDLDPGAAITGAGIPAAATITAVIDETTATLSAAATATATAVEAVVVRAVPMDYMLATVLQAREAHNAAQRGEQDIIGVGDYAIRARPLTAAVKQLLRPQAGVPVVG